jgi:hypothetical protein
LSSADFVDFRRFRFKFMKGNWGSGFETRSASAFARCYPGSFTFYLGNPFPRFCVLAFLIKSSVSICVDPWQTKIRRASNSSMVGLKMRHPGLRMKPSNRNL